MSGSRAEFDEDDAITGDEADRPWQVDGSGGPLARRGSLETLPGRSRDGSGALLGAKRRSKRVPRAISTRF